MSWEIVASLLILIAMISIVCFVVATRDRVDRRSAVTGVLVGVVLAVATFPINFALESSIGFWGVVAQWAVLPFLAGLIAYRIVPRPRHATRVKTALVTGAGVLALVLLFNPLTELLLMCSFDRTFYMIQFLGARCG
jgi:hypothetical protein